MFRLYADIQSDFGKSVLWILKKQYPDQDVNADPRQVGHKLYNIALKQNQYNDQRAQEAIQDFLTYLISANGGKGWNFPTQTSPKWEEALSAIYSNVRTRAMSKSMENSRRKKREKSVDDAFGVRGEGGSDPEGGEARMPTTDETALGKALDDKAAAKEFIDLIDDHVGDLKNSLTPASRVLFDLIFDHDVGGFGSDVKDNMGQAAELKTYLTDGTVEGKKVSEPTPEMKAIYEKNAKRWSGFVGDTRKKLLDEIWAFIDSNLTPGEYNTLKETFFADTTPSDVARLKKEKEKGKDDYQRGIDERKIGRYKWQEENGQLSPKDQTSYDSLKKKLQGQGVDLTSIEAISPDTKTKDLEKAKKEKSQSKPDTKSETKSEKSESKSEDKSESKDKSEDKKSDDKSESKDKDKKSESKDKSEGSQSQAASIVDIARRISLTNA